MDEFVLSDDTLEKLREESEKMAESARVIEGRWKRQTKIIFAVAICVTAIVFGFLGFLLADWCQVRLFSTSPQPMIDGKVPTQTEIDLIRGVRKQHAKNRAAINAPKNDEEIDAFPLRMELSKQALAIATTEFPEDKEKRLARFRELVGTPTKSPVDDVQRIADRVKEAQKKLKEGQTNGSSSDDGRGDSQ